MSAPADQGFCRFGGDESASAAVVCYKYGVRLTGYRGHASPGQIGQ